MNSNFTSREFRDALSSFATGVTIVTACGTDNRPIGMTASSFNSVSTNPPLVLWSVTKSAYGAPVFHQAEHFAIHILTAAQSDLSNRFAKRGIDKFSNVDYIFDKNNVPILKNVATRFDCKTWAIYEGGDHWIIVGHVQSIDTNANKGLIFGSGSYGSLLPLSTNGQDNHKSFNTMLFYKMSRAYHQMGQRFYQAIHDCGMSLSEWQVVACLYIQNNLTITELTQHTQLDGETLRTAISNLCEDGFLHTEKKDTNETIITCNTTGLKRVANLFEIARNHETQALIDLEISDISNLQKTLDTIINNTKNTA